MIDIACGDGNVIDLFARSFENDPSYGGLVSFPQIMKPVKFLGIDKKKQRKLLIFLYPQFFF